MAIAFTVRAATAAAQPQGLTALWVPRISRKTTSQMATPSPPAATLKHTL